MYLFFEFLLCFNLVKTFYFTFVVPFELHIEDTFNFSEMIFSIFIDFDTYIYIYIFDLFHTLGRSYSYFYQRINHVSSLKAQTRWKFKFNTLPAPGCFVTFLVLNMNGA